MSNIVANKLAFLRWKTSMLLLLEAWARQVLCNLRRDFVSWFVLGSVTPGGHLQGALCRAAASAQAAAQLAAGISPLGAACTSAECLCQVLTTATGSQIAADKRPLREAAR
jgi:hypothetical protein